MTGFYCTRVDVIGRKDERSLVEKRLLSQVITLTVTLQSSGDISGVSDVALTHLVGERIKSIDIEKSEILL